MIDSLRSPPFLRQKLMIQLNTNQLCELNPWGPTDEWDAKKMQNWKEHGKKRVAYLCSEPPKSKRLENHHFGSTRWKRYVALTDYGLKKRKTILTKPEYEKIETHMFRNPISDPTAAGVSNVTWEVETKTFSHYDLGPSCGWGVKCHRTSRNEKELTGGH